MRPDSETGVLLFAKEMREVLGRMGGEGTAFLRRSGGNDGRGESRFPRQGHRGPPLRSIRSNKIRRLMRRQRSVLFCGQARKVWG